MDSNRTCDESRIKRGMYIYKSIFTAELPSLQEMTACQISIEVWSSYISNVRNKLRMQTHIDNELPHLVNKNGIRRYLEKESDKLIETLETPRHIEQMVKKCLKIVRNETILCILHFKNGLFSTNLQEYKISQVDCSFFVWFPNGRIDYKNTAIKMLTSPELTEIQKFAITSHYCLENEIETFRRPGCFAESFVQKVTFHDDTLMFYWICYLKNQLYRIPRSISNLVDKVMAVNCDEECWEAFEYFWDRLGAIDQVTCISPRLRNYLDYRQNRLLHKMSHDQLTTLLIYQSVDMILIFFKRLKKLKYAIWVWMYTKHRISDEKFIRLVRNIFHPDTYNLEAEMSALLEIWDTATDSQKNHAVQDEKLECVVIFDETKGKIRNVAKIEDCRTIFRQNKMSPSGLKFVLKFLSWKSAYSRRKIIFECDSRFALRLDFDVINEIFNLCLPDPDDKVKFKKQRMPVVTTPYYCAILHSQDDFNELNRRVLFILKILNLASNYVKEFIESIIVNEFEETDVTSFNCCYSSDGWKLLNHFIDEIFPEQRSLVLKMKNSYMSSFANNTDPYRRCGNLNELRKIVEVEFVNERVKTLKRRCAKVIQKAHLRGWIRNVFIYKSFHNVFSWCFENDEEAFAEFKRIVSLDDIFNSIFGDLDKDYKFPPSLHSSRILERIAKTNKRLHEELLRWSSRSNRSSYRKNTKTNRSGTKITSVSVPASPASSSTRKKSSESNKLIPCQIA